MHVTSEVRRKGICFHLVERIGQGRDLVDINPSTISKAAIPVAYYGTQIMTSCLPIQTTSWWRLGRGGDLILPCGFWDKTGPPKDHPGSSYDLKRSRNLKPFPDSLNRSKRSQVSLRPVSLLSRRKNTCFPLMSTWWRRLDLVLGVSTIQAFWQGWLWRLAPKIEKVWEQ